MHPISAYHNHLERANLRQAAQGSARETGQGWLRRLLGLSVDNWRRRKMIAAFEAMDTRTLRDIGIERSNIDQVVDGYMDMARRQSPAAPMMSTRRDAQSQEPMNLAA